MIKEVVLEDKEKYFELGSLINTNFAKLYNLEDILKDKYDKVYGYYEDTKLVGFIHIKVLYETIEIINIVVMPNYRRRGIASMLIEYIISNINDVKEILLEVNENNKSAISVYNKNGFKVISERKRYYNYDTALVMKRDV